MDTLKLDLARGPLSEPVALNIGNPHAVFFVADADAVPLAEIGPELETDPLFPERANIGVAEVRDRRTIRLRVWERGVGLTRACGSGACAALVAAVRRDLSERAAEVLLDGGALRIAWNEAGRVLMTGPASHSFKGRLDPELLAVTSP
jgi:diaminopimelate epimerase